MSVLPEGGFPETWTPASAAVTRREAFRADEIKATDKDNGKRFFEGLFEKKKSDASVRAEVRCT